MKKSIILTALLVFWGCTNSSQNISLANEVNSSQNVQSKANNIQNVSSDNAESSESRKDSNPTDSKWAGEWSRNIRGKEGVLEITGVTSTKFKFTVQGYDGATTDQVEGTAEINGDKAIFENKAKECRLVFSNKGNSITIMTEPCDNYGSNISFGGEYVKGNGKKEQGNLVDKVFPNAETDKRFKELVGKDYERFLDPFYNEPIEEDDLDGLNAKVTSACVRGLCPFYTAIIMFDDKNNIWAAVTDDNGKKDGEVQINYYTNAADWKSKLPKTIENWTKSVGDEDDKKVINYKNR